jgi:hypothetical protein
MRAMKQTLFLLVLIAATVLAGCKIDHTNNFTPIENGNGYGYVTHVRGFTDRSLSAGLLYQDANGKRTRVWPYLELIDNNPVITNNLAVLVGGKAEIYDDGVERWRQRLIAFEAPLGLPLDITDQVLQEYCAESGVSFTNVTKDSFVSLTKTNGALQILFGIVRIGERGPGDITAHDATMTISWHDIEAIMQDIKQNGKLKKEKWSGTEYLQKE